MSKSTRKPRRPAGNAHLYLGKAGHLRVMSEFLLRGYNVATPEVDVGDDVYVVQDDSGKLWKIQVKTATANPSKKGYSAQVKMPLKQLRLVRDPEIRYIVAIREKKNWQPYIIIGRPDLYTLYKQEGIGSRSGAYVMFRFSFDKSSQKLNLGKRDLTGNMDNWEEWPLIRKSAPKSKRPKKK
jgi:hypothetical protein